LSKYECQFKIHRYTGKPIIFLDWGVSDCIGGNARPDWRNLSIKDAIALRDNLSREIRKAGE
jgi:hypothetical protein